MTTHISIGMICGIISPGPMSPQCGLEKSCAIPLLNKTKYSVSLEHSKEIQSEMTPSCQSNDELFWNKKLILQIGIATDIVSVTFIPKLLTQTVPLFMQKYDQVEKTVGFVAPYLSEDAQKTWDAVPQFPKSYVISDETSALKTIEELEGGLHQDIKECLIYFLKDTTTRVLVLTYLGPNKQYISCGWIKA